MIYALYKGDEILGVGTIYELHQCLMYNLEQFNIIGQRHIRKN